MQAQTKKQDITHLFTHALIAHPDIAFAPGNKMSNSYDKDCLTPKEFTRILHSLYLKNYMLVSPQDIYCVKDGKAIKKYPSLPDGKLPLILSFDDINYYTKKMHLGMVDKLVLDNKGNIASFTSNCSTSVSYTNEAIPILNAFIKAHPDFSYNNAHGTICLTGFDGILGYRTQSGSHIQKSEITAVKPLVNALKEQGWTFACHSYGHYHMKQLSVAAFCRDTNKWKSEVEPIIGATDIYVYPYGEWEIANESAISAKHEHLKKCGFKFFWGVGDKPFFTNMPLENIQPKSLFMDRTPIDGYCLRKYEKQYSIYFNPREVYDTVRIKDYDSD